MNHLTSENNPSAVKQRDYYIDNIKAVFIFLVVLGHLLDFLKDAGIPFATNVRTFIYFFHMPGFIFMSGYLAKSFIKKPYKGEKLLSFAWLYLLFKDAIELVHFIYDRKFFAKDAHTKIALLIILLFCVGIFLLSWAYSRFQTFRYIFIFFIAGVSLMNTNIFVIGGAPWYLLSLIFWHVFIYLTRHMNRKYVMAMTIIMAAILDYQEEIGKFLSLSRTINYLPFFLLGFYMSSEHFKKITDNLVLKRIAPFLLAAFFVLCTTFGKTVRQVFGVYMYGVSSYEKLPTFLYDVGAIFSLIWMVAATVMIFAIFSICPRRKTFFSYIGKNTLGVYVLHRLFKDLLFYGEFYNLLSENQYLSVATLALVSLFMIFVFGSNFCTNIINTLSKFPLQGLYNKKELEKQV